MGSFKRWCGGAALLLILAQCAPVERGGTTDAFWIGHGGDKIARLVPLGPPDPRLAAAKAVPPAAFVHPVLGPGGTELTELYPQDHIHHRGLFWAWHQIVINGVQRADGWLLTGMSFRPVSIRRGPNGESGTMVTDWLIDGRPILRETARIDAVPEGINVTLALGPLVDGLALGGSADDKGYGGISLRLRDPERMRFESLGHAIEARRQAVAAGAEMRFSWDSPSPGMPRTVTMRCTVDGRPITQWILRREKSMQNCAWPGAVPVALPKGRPITLTAEIRFE